LNQLVFMRLYSFNVNGIRSVLSKGFVEWLINEKPDFICLQEIKATPAQFDTSVFEKLGYYCFWFPADKPGYSGVAVLTWQKPLNVFYGMDIRSFDIEGRLIRTDFSNFSVISVYFPSGTSGDTRQQVKMDFLEEFEKYVLHLKSDQPNLIISGDLNIAHTEKDINYPKKHTKVSGFLPEEREWFTQFLSKGFIDSFREFNNMPEQYSWWTYRSGARGKNLGWRIDYHLVSKSLKERLVNAAIHPEVIFSDHCPVSIDIKD
jgi:exodeoxyribonuclease III